MLHYIVAICIFHQLDGIVDHRVHQLPLLLLGRLIQTPLDHTAAVPVSGYRAGVLSDGLVDEVIVRILESGQTPLDNMVPIKVSC